MAKARIRVALIDDHPIFRSGVRGLLGETAGIEVVGEASDGRHALDLVGRTLPDVVVMDITMTGMSGLAVARALRQAGSAVYIVFLTVNEDLAFVDEALTAGAQGYVLKRSAGASLLEAIEAVVSGGRYIDNEMRSPPSLPGRTEAGPTVPHAGEEGGLTVREREVLRLIALGMTMKEVSLAISISVASVDTYKIRGCKKLGLRSRASIVRYALGQGWLETESKRHPSDRPSSVM
ncbi:response regulator transcription factor [Methylorubrum rhodesianum]|jgi:DNA-binding NarL/FixJ family response regulator|uniref:response regulator transcription factor n=1 Tax=Methylorubrum TaxID=2282523 RepID=UPI00160AFD6D|nr:MULTISPECIES: response regulator transcription factor [Methylorubrum]MBB5765505.1 DNA-binding NarL/FixJ family response regulator [Methylorubrum rhodesianum]MBI1691699.1 DNA-binding response regulator [Methylorubrum sp. DB1722]